MGRIGWCSEFRNAGTHLHRIWRGRSQAGNASEQGYDQRDGRTISQPRLFDGMQSPGCLIQSPKAKLLVVFHDRRELNSRIVFFISNSCTKIIIK